MSARLSRSVRRAAFVRSQRRTPRGGASLQNANAPLRAFSVFVVQVFVVESGLSA